jgi:hypothetical protein
MTAPMPPDLPARMDLQARVQTLEHLVAMDALAFQLIAEHPEQAPQITAEALARIQRSAA